MSKNQSKCESNSTYDTKRHWSLDRICRITTDNRLLSLFLQTSKIFAMFGQSQK